VFSRLACAFAISVGCIAPLAAEPIVLKLSFFTSDRELAFQAAIKPFIDAVNEEGEGLVRVEAHTGGKLGQNFRNQAETVLQGTADIAFVNPGLTPARFPEQAVMQLPGMFRSAREATLVYNELMSERAFRDLDGFIVIGAVANYPLVPHMRPPITSLADLKGKRLRAANAFEASALKSFGAVPALTPINEVTDAISRGELDGATVPLGPLFEFGIARVASNHYLLPFGASPLLILMNAKRFEELPAQAQDIIRRHSGTWLAERYLEKYEARQDSVLEQIKTNPRRIVTEPSEIDMERARNAFASVRGDWQLAGSRQVEIYDDLERVLAAFRTRQ
jgi:TRAP-type C4-dicarboxylate transport system substrate-binding protein